MAKRALKEEGVDDLLPKRSKKEEPTDLAVANEDDTLPKRIFVGNLDMKVTEGHILKIFSKFGTVAQENFLWHHTGPRQHWQAARKRSQPPHGQYTDTPDETGSSRSRETPPRLHGGARARAPAPPQPRIRYSPRCL